MGYLSLYLIILMIVLLLNLMVADTMIEGKESIYCKANFHKN